MNELQDADAIARDRGAGGRGVVVQINVKLRGVSKPPVWRPLLVHADTRLGRRAGAQPRPGRRRHRPRGGNVLSATCAIHGWPSSTPVIDAVRAVVAMVSPLRRVASLANLDDDESLELMRLVRRGLGAVRAACRPDGFNISVNEGKIAGAGFAGRVHVHVVPR